MDDPICPKCNVNPCVYNIELDDWAYCVECQQKLIVAHKKEISVDGNLLESIGIPSRYHAASLKDFGMKGAELDPAKGVLVEGVVGAGKTHFLCSVARYWATMGRDVIFVPCVEIASNLKKLGFSGSEEYLDKLIKVDCLFLDDYGTQGNAEWLYSGFFRIVNDRYNENRYTCFSVNGRMCDRTDDRLSRRISEMTKRYTL